MSCKAEQELCTSAMFIGIKCVRKREDNFLKLNSSRNWQ